MSRIAGQSGRLTLKDSYVEFENWNIDESVAPWSGSFRIRDSDCGKVLAFYVSGQKIKAEFHEGNLKHSGEITIDGGPFNFSNPPGAALTVVRFSGAGGLNKSSQPQ